MGFICVYAVDQQDDFCKTDRKTDTLNWLKNVNDRKFFKFLTTLNKNQGIFCGKTTYDLLPREVFEGRKMIKLERSGFSLEKMFCDSPSGIIIGGYDIFKEIEKNWMSKIDSIITSKITVIKEKGTYLKDPFYESKYLHKILEKTQKINFSEDLTIEKWELHKNYK